MIGVASSLRKRMLSISLSETTFARRGFYEGIPATRQHLEQVGQTFLTGYHAALERHTAATLAAQLDTIDADVRGFAFEGAAMALALQDYLSPWRPSRVQSFLEGAGAAHVYMGYVGIGWAIARIPWGMLCALPRPDPLLKWLMIDGYGFHAGYFDWRQTILAQRIPRFIRGYARRVFDQGLGRSLWFVKCADIEQIQATIASFPSERHADLWSGLGLACAYAGGVDTACVAQLRTAAGRYLPPLAQGAAFAAKARLRAGNLTTHTTLACQIICGTSALAAAEITDIAAAQVSYHGSIPAYEQWRQRIQAFLAQEKEVVACRASTHS